MINVILLLLLVDKLTAIAIILSVYCIHKKKKKKYFHCTYYVGCWVDNVRLRRSSLGSSTARIVFIYN